METNYFDRNPCMKPNLPLSCERWTPRCRSVPLGPDRLSVASWNGAKLSRLGLAAKLGLATVDVMIHDFAIPNSACVRSHVGVTKRPRKYPKENAWKWSGSNDLEGPGRFGRNFGDLLSLSAVGTMSDDSRKRGLRVAAIADIRVRVCTTPRRSDVTCASAPSRALTGRQGRHAGSGSLSESGPMMSEGPPSSANRGTIIFYYSISQYFIHIICYYFLLIFYYTNYFSCSFQTIISYYLFQIFGLLYALFYFYYVNYFLRH